MKFAQILLASTIATATATTFANTEKMTAQMPTLTEEEVIISATPETVVTINEASEASSATAEMPASEATSEISPRTK